MRPHQVTILDVSKDAGVSPATVSRVLNHNTRVDPVLKDRVLDSVQRLNYFPNANAQSLKTRSTYEIGFLVSDIANFHYSTIAREVEDIISPHNYNLLLCSTDETKSREYVYLQMMRRRHVDGLIINPTCWNNSAIVALSQVIPVLLMHRRINDKGFRGDIIETDGALACKLLTLELLRAGHRKIYCVRGPDAYINAIERFQGFVDAMQEYGIQVDESYPYVFDGKFTAAGGKLAVERMLQFSDPPTAIISENNMSTIGILRQLLHYGIRIPEDISLVSHDQIDNMELFNVQPVTATYDLHAIAQCAGKALLERIHEPATNTREFLFPPVLAAGNSIAPPSPHVGEKLRSALEKADRH